MFRNRSLQGLIAAELVSLTGTGMTFVALPWFVLVTTGSTAKLGWVMAAQILPVGLFGIPSGSIVARIGAKRAMLVSDAARGPLMLVLPILHWTGHLSFATVLIVVLAVACVLNLVELGMLVGINALAYFQFSSAHVAGYLFGAFGAGALIGAVFAQRLVRRVDLLKLAAFGIVLMPLPLYAFVVTIP